MKRAEKEVVEAVVIAGALLANTAFNWKQHKETLTRYDRELLAQMQQRWDEAIQNMRKVIER